VIRTIFFLPALVSLLSMSHPIAATVGSPDSPYQVTASDHHKLLWLRVPKTGTRSVAALLRSQFGEKLNRDPYAYLWSDYDEEKYKEYFTFTVVRNPWDRILSSYVYWIVERDEPSFAECKGMNFKEFVRWIAQQDLDRIDEHFRPQVSFFPPSVEFSYVAHMENLDQEVATVLQEFGITVEQTPHINGSKHDHYSRYYDEETRGIVSELYKEDIERFGYEFEEQETLLENQ
jgi:chondroitin 4-sulfotransferase 11